MVIQKCLKILGIDENQPRIQQGLHLYVNMEKFMTEHKEQVYTILDEVLTGEERHYPPRYTQFQRDAILFDALLSVLPEYVNEEKGSHIYWPQRQMCFSPGFPGPTDLDEEQKVVFFMAFDINRCHQVNEATKNYQTYLSKTPAERSLYYTKECTLSSKVVEQDAKRLHEIWNAHRVNEMS